VRPMLTRMAARPSRMGYYPFGKKFFSNLTHYVRTGDFIAWLFANARTMDECAFAIGALSHYLGDSLGHPALRSYRTSVRSFIPAFAQAEVVLPGRQFPPHPEDEAYRIFAERVSRTNYDRKWKPTYRRR
jgi:hypothetical protein